MSEPITVRLCAEADIPTLASFEPHASARYAEQHFALQQAGDDYFYAVAFRGEEPLGTSVLDCRPGSLAPELKSLWVYPHARRQGQPQEDLVRVRGRSGRAPDPPGRARRLPEVAAAAVTPGGGAIARLPR